MSYLTIFLVTMRLKSVSTVCALVSVLFTSLYAQSSNSHFGKNRLEKLSKHSIDPRKNWVFRNSNLKNSENHSHNENCSAQSPLDYTIPQEWVDAGYLETQPGLFQKVGFSVPGGTIPLLNYYSVASNTFEIVENGVIIDGVEIGGSWTVGPGYIEQSGTGKFFAVTPHTFGNNMVFAAKLSLAELNHTAASFAFGNEHFGFDGGGNRFFTEGVTWGPPQFHGPASAYITPNTDFVLMVKRRGNSVSFYIDNNLIVTRTLDSSIQVDFVALRPWRNTMRVKTFRALGGGFNEDGSIVSPYTYSGRFNLSLPNDVLGQNEVGSVTVDVQDPYSFEEFVLDAYGH